jgi:hypothetical protein
VPVPAVMAHHSAQWQHKEKWEEQQVAARDQKDGGSNQKTVEGKSHE